MRACAHRTRPRYCARVKGSGSRQQQLRAPRAADNAAAEALKASTNGLSARFEQAEASAKQQQQVYADTDIMTSGDEDLPEVEDLTIENFDDKIKNADPPVVIVDFYTKWCGPCKLMYPRLCRLQQEYAGKITFFKVNCTKSFKEKGVELGIKVAPTFVFYKHGERERTITGAKLDAIKDALAELAA